MNERPRCDQAAGIGEIDICGFFVASMGWCILQRSSPHRSQRGASKMTG